MTASMLCDTLVAFDRHVVLYPPVLVGMPWQGQAKGELDHAMGLTNTAAATVFAGLRCRAAGGQRRDTAASVPRQPAVALPFRNPCRHRSRGKPPAATLNPLHQQESTWWRQARILVNVHPGRSSDTPVSVATHSLTGLPRMHNLHRQHS